PGRCGYSGRHPAPDGPFDSPARARIPGSADPPGDGGSELPRDRRHHRNAHRHGDVASGAGPDPVARKREGVPMSCDHILATQSYLDGQLNDAESDAAERHLQTCFECQQFAAQAADLSDALRNATRHPAPEFLRARVRAALRREAAPSKVRAFWWGAASGGGASALAAALALFLFLPPSAASLAEAVADAHARALTSGKTIMVASSNHHVVKPWLAAHVVLDPAAT